MLAKPLRKLSYKNIPDEHPKILIIDDDFITRKSMMLMIKKILIKYDIDFDLIEGTDGYELIDLVNDDIENNIKLIFTDENMSHCEGSEAIFKILHIKHKNKIRIISITAMEDVFMISKIFKCGADIVLAKPVSMNTIENIICEYVNVKCK